MKKDRIIVLLELLHVKVPKLQQRSGWIVSQCPFGPWNHDGEDKNPSFAVKLNTTEPFCNCFSCGFHGHMNELVDRIRNLNKETPIHKYEFLKMKDLLAEINDDALEDFDDPGIEDMLLGGAGKLFTEFPHWWLDSFETALNVDWAKDYLIHKRGMTPALIEKLDLRADSGRKRVCFPIRDFKGRLMGLHGRAVSDTAKLRWLAIGYQGSYNPLIWQGEEWADTTKPLVVVEGPFDLTSVLRVYDNVVSPLYANPSVAKLQRMSDASEWITLFDNGKGGDHGRDKISKAMKQTTLTHLKPPAGIKDPGEMTVAQLVELLSPYLSLKV